MTNTIRMISTADTLLSDMFKDAFGHRPRGVYPAYMCEASVEAEYDRLETIIGQEMQREAMDNIVAQRQFEERIAGYMADYDIDRATALRWDWEAEGADDDVGYWAYCNRIAYDLVPMYVAELRAAGLNVWAS